MNVVPRFCNLLHRKHAQICRSVVLDSLKEGSRSFLNKEGYVLHFAE